MWSNVALEVGEPNLMRRRELRLASCNLVAWSNHLHDPFEKLIRMDWFCEHFKFVSLSSGAFQQI